MADQPQSLGDFEKLHNDDEEMVSFQYNVLNEEEM